MRPSLPLAVVTNNVCSLCRFVSSGAYFIGRQTSCFPAFTATPPPHIASTVFHVIDCNTSALQSLRLFCTWPIVHLLENMLSAFTARYLRPTSLELRLFGVSVGRCFAQRLLQGNLLPAGDRRNGRGPTTVRTVVVVEPA